MVVGVGANIVKFSLIGFNILVLAAGACILGVSIAAYVGNPVQEYVSEYFIGKIANYNSLRAVLIIGMILGCIGIILGILGCIGALLEVKAILIIYGILLALLLIAQIIIGALVLAYQDQVHTGIDETLAKMQTSAANMLDPHHKEACRAYHDLARHHVCCGLEGHGYSTCQDPYISCGTEVGGKPCSSEVWRWVKVMAIVSGIILIVFIVMEIFAIICSILLIIAIRREQKKDAGTSGSSGSPQLRPIRYTPPPGAKQKVAPKPSEQPKNVQTVAMHDPNVPAAYPKQQGVDVDVDFDQIEIVKRNRD